MAASCACMLGIASKDSTSSHIGVKAANRAPCSPLQWQTGTEEGALQPLWVERWQSRYDTATAGSKQSCSVCLLPRRTKEAAGSKGQVGH